MLPLTFRTMTAFIATAFLTTLAMAGEPFAFDPDYLVLPAPDYQLVAKFDASPIAGPCGLAGCKCGCREGQLCVCYEKSATAKSPAKPVAKKTTPPQGYVCGPNGCYPASQSAAPRRTTPQATTPTYYAPAYGSSCSSGSCGVGYSGGGVRFFPRLRARFGFR